MEKFEYRPKGVCSNKIIYEFDNEIIINIEIIGGCQGNSMGVCNLCKNRNINDVINILKGIDCRGRGTSCPDQLAQGLIAYKMKRH